MGGPELGEMISTRMGGRQPQLYPQRPDPRSQYRYSEIYTSREWISEVTGVEVDTFAYPFGSMDPYVGDRTSKWGYTGAMGLGEQIIHSNNSLYYLQRIEIFGDMSLEEFQAVLPGPKLAERGDHLGIRKAQF